MGAYCTRSLFSWLIFFFAAPPFVTNKTDQYKRGQHQINDTAVEAGSFFFAQLPGGLCAYRTLCIGLFGVSKAQTHHQKKYHPPLFHICRFLGNKSKVEKVLVGLAVDRDPAKKELSLNQKRWGNKKGFNTKPKKNYLEVSLILVVQELKGLQAFTN